MSCGAQLGESSARLIRSIDGKHGLGEEMDDLVVTPELCEVLERQVDGAGERCTRTTQGAKFVQLPLPAGRPVFLVAAHDRLNGGYRSVTSVKA